MKLPACYRADAARVITASQKRAERARRWRSVRASLAYLATFLTTGLACAGLFFLVIHCTKG